MSQYHLSRKLREANQNYAKSLKAKQDQIFLNAIQESLSGEFKVKNQKFQFTNQKLNSMIPIAEEKISNYDDSLDDEEEESASQIKTRIFKKALKRLQTNRKNYYKYSPSKAVKNSQNNLHNMECFDAQEYSLEDGQRSAFSTILHQNYPDYSPCLPPVQTDLQSRKPAIDILIPQRLINRKTIAAKLIVPRIFDLPEFLFCDMPNDRKLFLYNPAPRGYVLKCTIVRYKSGFKRLWPEYKCFFSENQQSEIMYAKKKPQVTSSLHYIGLNSQVKESNPELCLGMLRGSFMGTVYDLYDNVLNSKKKKQSNTRAQFASFIYKSNLFAEQQEKESYFVIQKFNDYESIMESKPQSKNDEIYYKYKNKMLQEFQIFRNKIPEFSEEEQAFTLDFGDRVELPDTKNFQIVREGIDQEVYFQFGKIGSNVFNLDFKYPFSPFQAFAIALSTLDYKITAE